VKIQKTLPPVAVKISSKNLFHGLTSIVGVGDGGSVEKEIGECFGYRHTFSFSSGKAALCLLLTALESIKKRRKVVIPGYTCFSVASAVRKAGLEIALCDVRSDTLDFDFDQLEVVSDENTLCIVPTHLFGIRSDIGRVKEIADRKGIFVVEDSAQAFPASGGGGEGVRGDAEIFSFGRGKNITCGSGGLLLTSSEEIADALGSRFKNLETESRISTVRSLAELTLMKAFMHPWLYWFPSSLPFLKLGETVYNENYSLLKMNKLRYGFVSDWKKRMRSANDMRSLLGEKYKETLGVDRKQRIYADCIPYLRFPVYMKNSEAKFRILREYRHLGISGMYPSSICAVSELSGLVETRSCPGSADIAARLVTLPTHHFVTGDIMEKICSAVTEKISLCEPENRLKDLAAI